MADLQQELSQEITRIIGCSYSPSLRKLADILGRAGDDTICECLRDRPTFAISHLVDVIADQLALHAHTIRILQGLCHSLEFREHFLQRCPSALHALLTKANDSQRGFEGYSQTCSLLLSTPLPDVVVLPASTQAFFLRALRTTTRDPTISGLKQLYGMLDGACGQLFGDLSADVRHSFDDELYRIICEACPSREKESVLQLYAIGIAVLIGEPKEWRTSKKLFGSLRDVHRTLNLTTLNVLWVLRESSEEANQEAPISKHEAAEGIGIATKVMQTVEKTTRENWPTSDPRARGSFLRLPEKLLGKNIDPVVQLEGLCFYATIAGENNLHTDSVAQFETILLGLRTQGMNLDRLRGTMSFSFPIYAPRLKDSTIFRLSSQILQTCTSVTSMRDVCSATVLVERMAASIPRCENLRNQMLVKTLSDYRQGNIASFLESDLGHDAVGPETSSCQTAIKNMRRKLMASTVSMLLTLALTARSSEPGLPDSLAIALIDKQQRLTQLSSACMHTKVHMPQTVAFFEQESTPSTGALRQSWKNRLYKELEMQNLYQRESVVRSVAQICHDLEDRCETVEEPLRLEQAKVKDLTIQADQLREQIESFQTKATDQQFRMEGLEADYENAEEENSALTLRLENLEEEKSELALGLKNLKAEFDVAVRQADDVLRAAREGFHTNKSQLESTLVRKEEELHLRSVRIAEMDSQISRLQDEVQAKEQEVKNHGESQAKLSLDLQESKQALEAERSTVAQQTEQIAKLQADGNELEHQLSCSKNEVTTLTDQCNEVSTRYRALEASSKQELEDLEARCEQELDLATTKASEEYETLHAQLQDALHNTEQVKSAYEDTQRRLESAQATVSSLEVKVQELSEAYSEKDEQLQELESWRRSIIDRAPKTPRQSRRRKSARHLEDDLSAQIPEGGQGITHTAMETVANASFSSGDSFSTTPKRQKPRPTFKIPAMHTPHGQKLGAAPKILSHRSAHAKRPALRAVSPNRRHTTVGVALEQLEEKEGGEKKRSSLHLIQQGSFDMDTFLASTPMPFTPGNVVFGTGREPTEEQEETTEL